MSKSLERRMAAGGLEVREADGTVTLTGYASTFNQPYDMGWYSESVDPNAFRRTLAQNPDVRLLINHAGLPLGRTTSGTLRLGTDDKGLTVSADLDTTDPDVASLVPKMRRGDLSQMSFAFRTNEDVWENDMSKRTLLALDLNDGDVSVVTYPANPGATAAVRSDGPAFDAVASAMRSLENRAASYEDIASVLTRAQAYFTSLISGIKEDLAAPNQDDEAKDAAMVDAALAASCAHEIRARELALRG